MWHSQYDHLSAIFFERIILRMRIQELNNFLSGKSTIHLVIPYYMVFLSGETIPDFQKIKVVILRSSVKMLLISMTIRCFWSTYFTHRQPVLIWYKFIDYKIIDCCHDFEFNQRCNFYNISTIIYFSIFICLYLLFYQIIALMIFTG